MKREILFRGKLINIDKWVKGSHFEGNTSAFILCKKNLEANELGLQPFKPYQIIPETVSQFTGLLDKNGNKIFEGDIIKFIYSPELLKLEIVGTVCLNYHFNWSVQAPSPTGDGISFYHTDNFNRSEIIGNIHDNPELL